MYAERNAALRGESSYNGPNTTPASSTAPNPETIISNAIFVKLLAQYEANSNDFKNNLFSYLETTGTSVFKEKSFGSSVYKKIFGSNKNRISQNTTGSAKELPIYRDITNASYVIRNAILNKPTKSVASLNNTASSILKLFGNPYGNLESELVKIFGVICSNTSGKIILSEYIKQSQASIGVNALKTALTSCDAPGQFTVAPQPAYPTPQAAGRRTRRGRSRSSRSVRYGRRLSRRAGQRKTRKAQRNH